MRFFAALLAVFGAASPAVAQSANCRIPERISVPHVRADAPMRRTVVTGYTLALSWSPEFCRGKSGERQHMMQCGGQMGRFGFIVHGLWPEGHGRYPQWCQTRNTLDFAELRRNMCIMPSAYLQAHEWAKHGSCMSKTPAGYFKATRILWNSLHLASVPRAARSSAPVAGNATTGNATAGALRKAFVDANKGWRTDAVGIKTTAGGFLSEILLCYDKGFLPTRCDRRRYGASDRARIRMRL